MHRCEKGREEQARGLGLKEIRTARKNSGWSFVERQSTAADFLFPPSMTLSYYRRQQRGSAL